LCADMEILQELLVYGYSGVNHVTTLDTLFFYKSPFKSPYYSLYYVLFLKGIEQSVVSVVR